MAFINKNIAPVGWTFAPLICLSGVGTSPFFISFLGFTYIELQMDKLLPKSESRFYLGGMTKHWIKMYRVLFSTDSSFQPYSGEIFRDKIVSFHIWINYRV